MNRINIIGPHILPVRVVIECSREDEDEVLKRMRNDGWQRINTSLRHDSAQFTFQRGESELLNGQHCILRELLS